MRIDWITVLAQLANFLLLVWLLYRFLYRPILAGIDAREAEIARRMAVAEQARAEARAAQAHFEAQYQQSVSERDAVVARALEATREERTRLMAEARAQRDREQLEWQQQLELERRDFHRHLQQTAALTMIELAHKVVSELADEPLENLIARHLVRQLPARAQELAHAAGSQRQAQVSSRSALEQGTQEHLRDALRAIVPELECVFRVDPRQAPGVVIQLGGARLDWTLDSYIDGFERALSQHQHGQAPGLAITDAP